MNLVADSSPSCSNVRRSGLALLAAMMGAGAGLTSCKKEEPVKEAPPPAKVETAPVTEAPKPPVEPAPAPPPVEKPAATTAAPSAPEVSDKELSQRVAAFKAFHPYATGAELSRIPQFASQLEKILDATAKDPALLARVQQATKDATDLSKGARLNLKVSNYSLTFSDRLLAAVLSGQPERLVDLVLRQSPAAEFVIAPNQ